MNDDHPFLTTVGIAAVALGVLMVVQPGLAATIGVGYAAVLLVGTIAFVQAIRVARARQRSEVRTGETPDVETVESVPTPGEEFDRTVATLRSGPRRVLIRDRADLRERVEDAAVTAVADRENCSPAEAEQRIDAGTWTDDPHAAAFLGGPDAPRPSLIARMKLAASPESQFQHRVRRTADAVARAAGVAPDDGTGTGSGDAGDGTAAGDGAGDASTTDAEGGVTASDESDAAAPAAETGSSAPAGGTDDADRADDGRAEA